MREPVSYPKILIVGTLPYNKNESSRALKTYFENFPEENLGMIFSSNIIPQKGICSSMFRITDYELIKKFFHPIKCKQVGTIFHNRDLCENQTEDKVGESLNKFKSKNALRFYARRFLWKRGRWLTSSLEKWVEEFNPDIIYICFSDDYFVLDIGYYFAKKYNKPIIAQIGDDYYFKKYNFLYWFYLIGYKRLFKKIMSTKGFGVYISEKLANKYNSVFIKKGVPIYLGSSIKRGKNNEIKFEYNYFGKIGLGRYKTLSLLGSALLNTKNGTALNVYSDEKNKKMIRCLEKNGCKFHNSIPYKEVVEIMNSGCFNIIASGFSKKNIEDTRYSLSTKVPDCLISNGPIIVVGPKNDGAVDFFDEKGCAIVLKNKNALLNDLNDSLNKTDLKKNMRNALLLYKKTFDVNKNRGLFEKKCFSLLRNEEDINCAIEKTCFENNQTQKKQDDKNI